MSVLLDQPPVHPSITSIQDDGAIIAPIMPTAYWVSQGMDEATAFGLERFQCQLVERKTIYGHVIYLEPAVPDVELIPHHDMLVHHWKRYIKNLVERGRAKALFIERFQLNQSVLRIIVPSLMQYVGGLGELGLCNCGIDRNGLLLISDFLSKNQTLKRLLLNGNQIEDVDVAKALSTAVKNHPSMEELCISHCRLGDNAEVLPEILRGCDRLKILRLNDNNIQNATHIGAFLASPIALTTLRLDKNLLSDADAGHIAAAIKSNDCLNYLYLAGNGFSDEGKTIITTAVLDTTSLNSIADSNHNCEVVYNTPAPASHINEKYWSIMRKVQSKILIALYDLKNETLPFQYFADCPLELIPRVLHLIQKEMDCLEQHDVASFGEKNEPRQLLSRIFCFLRVWNMPWLFNSGVQQIMHKRQKTLN